MKLDPSFLCGPDGGRSGRCVGEVCQGGVGEVLGRCVGKVCRGGVLGVCVGEVCRGCRGWL